MTMREVMIAASRKAGASEEWIAQCQSNADRLLLKEAGLASLSSVDKEFELKPGRTYEEMIDELSLILPKIWSLSPKDRADLENGAIQKHKNNVKKN